MAKLQLMVPNQCHRDDRFMDREKKRGGWEMWRFRTGLAGAKDQTGFLRK